MQNNRANCERGYIKKINYSYLTTLWEEFSNFMSQRVSAKHLTPQNQKK